MRTVVDIPDEQISLLKQVGERDHLSRAEMVRRAVADYIAKCMNVTKEDGSFGLWKDRREDGVAMQQRLRKEWEP